jgi:hypothetical protein
LRKLRLQPVCELHAQATDSAHRPKYGQPDDGDHPDG